MKLPSKELLSKVLSKECVEITILDNDIWYRCIACVYGKNRYIENRINIYELSSRCKYWAYDKGGIDIHSGKKLLKNNFECLIYDGSIPYKIFEADTEPEAIFKACEWIMEQTKCGS